MKNKLASSPTRAVLGIDRELPSRCSTLTVGIAFRSYENTGTNQNTCNQKAILIIAPRLRQSQFLCNKTLLHLRLI